ncbi:MAG TPA: hypothetical protein VJ718_01355 [Candidatus Binataceae bacterium]|nr:hypothetical protein [Candidatus Binataceae bacterium]
MALAFALTAALCTAGCAESAHHRADRIEAMLAASGFRMHPADTEEHQRRLETMPPLKLQYFFVNGKPRYWFADPQFCKCIYIGNEHDYQNYQSLRLQEQIARRQQEAAELNESAAQQYQMNMMMWPGPFFF